jgi:hypothetical protein
MKEIIVIVSKVITKKFKLYLLLYNCLVFMTLLPLFKEFVEILKFLVDVKKKIDWIQR